ncbi:uncharacterized protein LAESUDRAFT_711019 [Laetiporus sulphureus 93-53]|uniref:F-box domain-containing protein n=1 Tax=Laetiporus sulphureus 93-53 TaxID=1314785 RepID=A0A165HCQ7_9APHY|nr:uncharacterized protein LAESUDRAFT_711019 [Laetiporus sulphureus 93-53]KZT11555.1 hypothetical protein LAESUDRAFT_711019 [Laetiporus sulphureus 93-53]
MGNFLSTNSCCCGRRRRRMISSIDAGPIKHVRIDDSASLAFEREGAVFATGAERSDRNVFAYSVQATSDVEGIDTPVCPQFLHLSHTASLQGMPLSSDVGPEFHHLSLTILDLPNELLINIVGLLPTEDLFSIIILSRRLHCLAITLLLSRYDLHSPEKGGSLYVSKHKAILALNLWRRWMIRRLADYSLDSSPLCRA